MKDFEKHLSFIYLFAIIISFLFSFATGFKVWLPVTEYYFVDLVMGNLIVSIGIFMIQLPIYVTIRVAVNSVKKHIDQHGKET